MYYANNIFNTALFSEFCGHENVSTEVREEEIPKADTIDYALSAPEPQEEQVAMGAEAEKTEATKPATTGSGYVVYCLDISGSMGGTTQLPELQGEWDIIYMYIDICRTENKITTFPIELKYIC